MLIKSIAKKPVSSKKALLRTEQETGSVPPLPMTSPFTQTLLLLHGRCQDSFQTALEAFIDITTLSVNMSLKHLKERKL